VPLKDSRLGCIDQAFVCVDEKLAENQNFVLLYCVLLSVTYYKLSSLNSAFCSIVVLCFHFFGVILTVTFLLS